MQNGDEKMEPCKMEMKKKKKNLSSDFEWEYLLKKKINQK